MRATKFGGERDGFHFAGGVRESERPVAGSGLPAAGVGRVWVNSMSRKAYAYRGVLATIMALAAQYQRYGYPRNAICSNA